MKIACIAACIALTWLTTIAAVPLPEDLEPVCRSKFDYDLQLLSKLLSMEFNYNKQVESFIEREKQMNEKLNALRESSTNLSMAFKAFREEMYQVIEHLEANTTATAGKHEVDLTFLKTEIDKFKEISKPIAAPGPVAFAVQKVANKDVARDEKIVYSEVLLDTDGGYDTNTGVFTVPRDGVYLFSAQTYVKTNCYISVGLVAGGKQLTIGYREDLDKHSSYTVVGVGQLRQGQQAYVKMKHRKPATGDVMFDGWAYNTFQGVLIR